MKRPQSLLLALVLSGAALSGCQSTPKWPQFSEVSEDTSGVPQRPLVSLQIVGFRDGLAPPALAAGLRKSLGVSSNVYTDEEMWRDARALADELVAGGIPVIRVDRDAAEWFGTRLEQAGLILEWQRNE